MNHQLYAAILVALIGCTSPDDMSNITRVDELMADYTGGVPGASALVVRQGRIVLMKAYGLADVERGTPTSTATNYRLASVTKQFTATAVMMLIEDGHFTYDTRLTDIFEDFPPYGSQVTVEHLLTHTSGLLAYEDFVPDTATVQVKDADVLEIMRKQTETYFEPGTDYRYSNSAYALLALTVEKYAGMPFADFLRHNIFGTLEMNGTVAFEDGRSTVESRAFGHVDSAGTFIRRDQSITSAVLGDGGVYSSVEDLYKWDQALYGDEVLPQRVLENAWTPKPNTEHDDGEQYGYGWYVDTYSGHKVIRHSGSTMGFRNDFERFPDLELTVYVLTNRNSPEVIELTRQIADVFLESR